MYALMKKWHVKKSLKLDRIWYELRATESPSNECNYSCSLIPGNGWFESLLYATLQREALDRLHVRMNIILLRYTASKISRSRPWPFGSLDVIGHVSITYLLTYGFKARRDRNSGSSPYDSLESLVSNAIICVPLGEEIPSNDGIKERYDPLEIVLLPHLAHLA